MVHRFAGPWWRAALAAAAIACGGSGRDAVVPRFVARGGRGLTGAGGAGGAATIRSEQGGIVRVSTALPAAQQITLEEPAPPDLGSNPRTVAEDEVVESATLPLRGDDGHSEATGLWVRAGRTLTLLPSGDGDVELTLPAGALIEGALVTGPRDTGVRAGLQLRAEAIRIGPAGSIDLSGAGAGDVGDGGDASGCVLIARRGLVNHGTLSARGGSGGSTGRGGKGGSVVLAALGGAALNEGELDVSGGASPSSAGGRAGEIQLACLAIDGSCNGVASTGRLLARGASGATAGGEGGAASLRGAGVVIGSGVLDVSGGDAMRDGLGGAGGTVVIEGSGARLSLAGTIHARGGAGAGIGVGGEGGSVQLVRVSPPAPAEPAGSSGVTPAGVISAAELDASGGDGASGGGGGTLLLVDRPTMLGTAGETLEVKGPDSIDVSGGEGSTGGGAGGMLALRSEQASSPGIGSVACDVELLAEGGRGVAGAGGRGGEVLLDGSAQLSVSGVCSVRGGSPPPSAPGRVVLNGAEAPLTDGRYVP